MFVTSSQWAETTLIYSVIALFIYNFAIFSWVKPWFRDCRKSPVPFFLFRRSGKEARGTGAKRQHLQG